MGLRGKGYHSIHGSNGLPLVRDRGKGSAVPISCDQETYNANLVALPAERTEEFLSLLGQR